MICVWISIDSNTALLVGVGLFAFTCRLILSHVLFLFTLRTKCKGCCHCSGTDLSICVWKQERNFITCHFVVRQPNQAPSIRLLHIGLKGKQEGGGRERTPGPTQLRRCKLLATVINSSPFWILFWTVLYCKNKSLQDMKLLLFTRHSIYFCSNFCVFISRICHDVH